MANLAHKDPTAAVDGFRLETGAAVPGTAMIRGTASDQCKAAGAAATALLGVVDLEQNTSTAGDVVALRLWTAGHIAYARAGAAIAIDAKLSVDASGQFITGVATNKALAKALGPAAAAGDLFPVIFLDGDLTL